MNDPSQDPDRARQLLAAHMEKAALGLDRLLDTYGVSLPVLGKAMADFTLRVFDLPGDAACRAGCAHCCHLRVGVSIPELLVIFDEFTAGTAPGELARIKARVMDILAQGNPLTEDFWRETQTPCPFLDPSGCCLIYDIRPFSCRAYHSTDRSVCKQGFDGKQEVQVPCFPLYRASTDMYSSIFIKVLAARGFPSFQVGFVAGLGLLFTRDRAGEEWLDRRDVFSDLRL